jgi:hypothetical protein
VEGRAQLRPCLCILLATLATGCGSVREFLHIDQVAYPADWSKTQPYPPDNSLLDRSAIGETNNPANTAVQAAGMSGNGAPPGGQPAQPNQLQAPTPLPATTPTGQPPYAQPGANSGQPGINPGQPGTPVYGMQPGDPHLRTMPTAMGGRLDLAPWEVPADRVVELSKQLETLNALNRSLLARIRELEAHGATREQSLAEAVRDVERADDEVARTRSTLQISREDAAVLRARLQVMEKEDIETLKAVILALDRLLNPPLSRGVP